MTLLDPNGVPIQGATVTSGLTMPGMAMSPLSVTLVRMTPHISGSYQVQAVLSMPGAWHAVASVSLPNHGQTLQTA